MAAYGDALTVGDPQTHDFIDCRFGIHFNLFGVGIIRLFPTLADDGHGKAVEHRVTTR